MQEIIGYTSYTEYKGALDAELQRTTEGFVRIGYLLKVARDTDILKESGYANVNDFAKAEYGIDKTQVSRFIHINDRFSEGGYSDQLKIQYQGFGYAKLAIMLQLPDAINEEITPGFSKTEVQAIKDEVDAEHQISDLEVLMEEPDRQQGEYGLFAKVLHQLGRDTPELYLKLYDAIENTVYEGTNAAVVDKLMDALAPAGEAIHTVRIPGEGRKMLSIKGKDIRPTITDIRSNEKRDCSWDEFILDMETLCESADAKESWEKLYGEPFPVKEEPKKAEVAPVQPKKEPAPKKPPKVTKAKVENPAPVVKEPEPEEEEQLPGQMNVENYPEILPEGYEKAEVAPVQPENESENVENTQLEEASEAETEENEVTPEESEEKPWPSSVFMAKKDYLEKFKEEIAEAEKNAEAEFYKTARTHWEKAGEYLEELQKIQEAHSQQG